MSQTPYTHPTSRKAGQLADQNAATDNMTTLRDAGQPTLNLFGTPFDTKIDSAELPALADAPTIRDLQPIQPTTPPVVPPPVPATLASTAAVDAVPNPQSSTAAAHPHSVYNFLSVGKQRVPSQQSQAAIPLSKHLMHMPSLLNQMAQHGSYTTVPTIDLSPSPTRQNAVQNAAQNALTTPPAVTSTERYTVKKELGVGGMGRVLLAVDNDIGRPVAVKVLGNAIDQNEGLYQQLFIDECRITGRLEHPNIIPIHDVSRDGNGQIFYTMRYVEGESLGSVIRKLMNGDASTLDKYTFDVRIRIMSQVIAALKLANSKGVIHRDIKPDNIMIGNYGEVFVVDWGLAILQSDSRDSGSVAGTPAYMSPEQARGQRLDLRSDLYSLCTVFYEFMALKHPLHPAPTTKSPQDMMLAVVSQEVPWPEGITSEYQRPVPRSLVAVLMRGLVKDRDQRYQTWEELEHEISLYLDGRSPVICMTTAMTASFARLSRVVDRWPNMMLGLLVFVGLMTLIGVSVFFYMSWSMMNP